MAARWPCKHGWRPNLPQQMHLQLFTNSIERSAIDRRHSSTEPQSPEPASPRLALLLCKSTPAPHGIMQCRVMNGAMTGSKPAAQQRQWHHPAVAATRRCLRHRAASTDAGGHEGSAAAMPAADDIPAATSTSAPPAAPSTTMPQPAEQPQSQPGDPASSPSGRAARSSPPSRPPSSSGSRSSNGAPNRLAAAATAPREQRRQPPRLRLQSFLQIDDGPPRVMSPLDPSLGLGDLGLDSSSPASREHLPLLLYLPGIDGSGLAASRQFPSLLRRFDMKALVTPPQVGWARGGRVAGGRRSGVAFNAHACVRARLPACRSALPWVWRLHTHMALLLLQHATAPRRPLLAPTPAGPHPLC